MLTFATSAITRSAAASIPNLKNLELLNDRTEPRYRELGVLEMYAG